MAYKRANKLAGTVKEVKLGAVMAEVIANW